MGIKEFSIGLEDNYLTNAVAVFDTNFNGFGVPKRFYTLIRNMINTHIYEKI